MANQEEVKFILKAQDMASDEIRKLADEFGGLSGKLTSMFNSIGAGGQIFAGIATAATATVAIGKQLADTAISIERVSKSAGSSGTDLQVLRRAFQDWGLDSERADKAVLFLTKNMDSQKKTLHELGITTRDPIDAMVRLGQVFNTISDAGHKADIDTKLFGKSGKDLAPILQSLAAEFDNLKDRMSDAGLIMSDISREQALEFKKQMDDVGVKWDGLWFKMKTSALPAANEIVNAINSIWNAMNHQNEQHGSPLGLNPAAWIKQLNDARLASERETQLSMEVLRKSSGGEPAALLYGAVSFLNPFGKLYRQGARDEPYIGPVNGPPLTTKGGGGGSGDDEESRAAAKARAQLRANLQSLGFTDDKVMGSHPLTNMTQLWNDIAEHQKQMKVLDEFLKQMGGDPKALLSTDADTKLRPIVRPNLKPDAQIAIDPKWTAQVKQLLADAPKLRAELIDLSVQWGEMIKQNESFAHVADESMNALYSGLKTGFGGTFSAILGEGQTFSGAMRQMFQQLEQDLVDILAQLAADEVFKFIVSIVSPAAGKIISGALPTPGVGRLSSLPSSPGDFAARGAGSGMGSGGNTYYIQSINAKTVLDSLLSPTGEFRRANDRIREINLAARG